MFEAPRRSEERDALAFLNEPLYQLTSWFEPTVWALWPYAADRWSAACAVAVDPLYALWRRRAQVFVGEHDVVVFVLKE